MSSSDSDEGEGHDQAWLLDDSAHVTVDALLLDQLRQEVDTFLARSPGKNSRTDCPFCPWRRFQRFSRVRDHVRKHHIEHAQVCCSGTKQPRVILSLHDTDMCGCARRGIRSRVKPAPRTACNNIDRWIRLVLKMPLGRDSWPARS